MTDEELTGAGERAATRKEAKPRCKACGRFVRYWEYCTDCHEWYCTGCHEPENDRGD